MHEDKRQRARLAQAQELLVGQLVELVLVDGEIGADHILVAVRTAHGDLLIGEQIEILDDRAEALGRQMVLVEGLTEFHRLVDGVGRLTLVEEREIRLVAHQRRFPVDTQGQLGLILVLTEDERIAADIGRDVDRVGPLAVLGDKQVFLFLHAQHRNRHRRLGAGKHDRIMLEREIELDRVERHRMGTPGKIERMVDLFQAQLAVQRGREWLDLGVENGAATGRGLLLVTHTLSPGYLEVFPARHRAGHGPRPDDGPAHPG